MSYFYLATRYSDKERMKTVARVLRNMGHHVDSSWIDEPYSPSVQVSDVSPEKLQEVVGRDMAEIAACDVLVQFAEEPNARGGAIVEYGISLGLKTAGYDIDTVLVGKRRNIFDHWEGVRFFETEDEFLVWAKTLSPKEPIEIKDLDLNFDDVDLSGVIVAKPIEIDGIKKWKYQGIALSGKAGSGKDLLCKMLLERLGDGWRREAFADALKMEWHNRMFGGNESKRDIVEFVNSEKSTVSEVRRQLIALGQARRAEDPLYWCKRVDLHSGCIITDMRFCNEWLFLKDRGFYMVRIECSAETLTTRGCPPIDDISETELDNRDDWNITVSNNAGPEVLELAADEIAKAIKEG